MKNYTTGALVIIVVLAFLTCIDSIFVNSIKMFCIGVGGLLIGFYIVNKFLKRAKK